MSQIVGKKHKKPNAAKLADEAYAKMLQMLSIAIRNNDTRLQEKLGDVVNKAHRSLNDGNYKGVLKRYKEAKTLFWLNSLGD